MKSIPSAFVKVPAKAPTGVVGFDQITGGGLPRGRTTLLLGGPGSGKTVLALQFLVHGARDCKEPGIFVAFEETSKRIMANAESFGWNLEELRRKQKLFFMDAQPLAGLVQSGNFDLGGMLAALGAQARAMGARRIVFDALDVVLSLLPEPAAQKRETYRLHEWLLERETTGIITLKSSGNEAGANGQQPFGFMQFMVDCGVVLGHRVEQGVSLRTLRVIKYRGSGYDENESPFLIGNSGFEVAIANEPVRARAKVTSERVSSGVKRLDTMLCGGYFRGASVLITGFSGTAKTTLSAAFVEAACGRGERSLFVSFDSEYAEVLRNLASVGIRLDRYVKNGCLRMISARTIAGSAETYLMRIKTLANELQARCVVIDPVSLWSRSGNEMTAQSVADRLIHWAKGAGVTLVCTSLLDEMSSQVEGNSQLQISTLADTWIHLSYVVQAGERNRGLSIIKSRGTEHSNQVRELILSAKGVTLSDAYTAGGEVLMGTLRWEKEQAEIAKNDAAALAGKRKRVTLDAEEAEIGRRAKALQVELTAKQVEKALLARTTQSHKMKLSHGRTRIRQLRRADAKSSEQK